LEGAKAAAEVRRVARISFIFGNYLEFLEIMRTTTVLFQVLPALVASLTVIGGKYNSNCFLFSEVVRALR
jgi:hypothetical protein